MRFPTSLNHEYYGNPLGDWIVAAGIFVGALLLMVLIRRVLVRRAGEFSRRTATEIDDLAVDLIRHARFYFLLVAALVLASLSIDVPTRWEKAYRVILVLAVVLQLGVWINRLVGFWINRYVRRSGGTGASATTLSALGIVVRFLLWSLLVILGLDNVGFKITTIVTGLGIGGIAIALAVQNILGDLFGALAIVLDKPFVVGDSIVVDGFQGTVEHVGLKTTRLRSITGEQIVISNTDLLRSRIRNYQSVSERRQMITFGLPLDTPPEKVARVPEIIRDVITVQPLTRFDRSHFTCFGESTLLFETVYFVKSPDYGRYMDTQQTVNLELLRRFAAEGITIAIPSRRVVAATDGAPRVGAALAAGTIV